MVKTLSLLTDKQAEALQTRLYNMGRDKLIVSLENELINANMLGNVRAAERLEQSLEWVKNNNGWIRNG